MLLIIKTFIIIIIPYLRAPKWSEFKLFQHTLLATNYYDESSQLESIIFLFLFENQPASILGIIFWCNNVSSVLLRKHSRRKVRVHVSFLSGLEPLAISNIKKFFKTKTHRLSLSALLRSHTHTDMHTLRSLLRERWERTRDHINISRTQGSDASH